MVAAIERHSAHPVARALSSGLTEIELPQAKEVQEITGAGISGLCSGRRIVIASTSHLSRELGGLPAEATEAAARFANEGLSPVAVAVDQQVVAIAGIGDPLRHDSAESVAVIRARGWQVEILSGDHPAVVRSIAEKIGVEPAAARGAATPEDKLDAVREAAQETSVAMVGDGVNDAAALAAATVGIGVHGGAEAALAAADVYLGRPGLEPVVDLLRGSRRTLGVIRRNLVFSLTYNVIAVTFAITGHMSPLLAAILMPLSSMTVVLSSYRARTF
jgi:Cu2+-exporting ATPase